MIVTLIFSSPTPLTPMQTPACYTSQQPAPLHQTFPARLTKAPLLLQHRQPAGQALSTSLPMVSLHAATGHQVKIKEATLVPLTGCIPLHHCLASVHQGSGMEVCLACSIDMQAGTETYTWTWEFRVINNAKQET
jgi:hypothetical protein